MDVAKCIENDRDYTAHEFSRLPSSTVERMRRLLVCSGCGNQAFFRKASVSGQAACFGARPHEEGCDFQSVDHTHSEDESTQEQDLLENPGNRVVVDFLFGATEVVTPPESAPGDGRSSRGAFTRVGSRPEAKSHRRPGPLLRNLIHSSAFRESLQVVEVNGGEYVIRDFFIEFKRVTASHANEYHGFWGMISDAKYTKDGTLWINSGGRFSVSICVSPGLIGSLFERYHINDVEDFAGSYCLVFSEMSISINNKKYIPLENINHIAFRM